MLCYNKGTGHLPSPLEKLCELCHYLVMLNEVAEVCPLVFSSSCKAIVFIILYLIFVT